MGFKYSNVIWPLGLLLLAFIKPMKANALVKTQNIVEKTGKLDFNLKKTVSNEDEEKVTYNNFRFFIIIFVIIFVIIWYASCRFINKNENSTPLVSAYWQEKEFTYDTFSQKYHGGRHHGNHHHTGHHDAEAQHGKHHNGGNHHHKGHHNAGGHHHGGNHYHKGHHNAEGHHHLPGVHHHGGNIF